jgi:hypothetical protein
MQFSGASANGGNGDRPSEKKQPYIRPKGTFVTPDQAEAWVRAKAAPESQEFENCSELIAEARRRRYMAEIEFHEAVRTPGRAT